MLCYKDRTFCGAEECKSFTECGRALTERVRDGAKACGLHIAQFANPETLDCYKPKSEIKNEKHENTIPQAKAVC
jgi:hypothetical protein